jgi:hypothetical protein
MLIILKFYPFSQCSNIFLAFSLDAVVVVVVVVSLFSLSFTRLQPLERTIHQVGKILVTTFFHR